MNCPSCNYEISGKESQCPGCGTALKQPLSAKISSRVDGAIGQEGVAPVMARFTRFSNKVSLVVISFILAIEIGFLVFGVMHGVPFYVFLIFILPTIGMMALTIRANKKISQINFQEPEKNYIEETSQSVYKGQVSIKPGTNLFGEGKISLDPGESLLTYLSPIYRLQANFSGPSMVSVERFTENVIAVTDRRILFFTIALSGQGMLINGASQDYLNDELKRNTLSEMAADRIKQLKTGNSIDHFPNDFWVDRSSLAQVMYLKGIGPIKYLYAGAIGFKPQGGKKLRYQVVSATNFDEVIGLLNAQKKLAI